MTPETIAEITQKLNNIRALTVTEVREDLSDTMGRIGTIDAQVDHFRKFVDETATRLKESVDALAKALIDFENQRKSMLEKRLVELQGDNPIQ